MDRYINHIFTANPQKCWSNQELLPNYQQAIESLKIDDKQKEDLLDSVRFFLVGKRNRFAASDLLNLDNFADRASAFEVNAELLIDKLVQQIITLIDNRKIHFDAIVTTTSTGNLMPGLSYRMAGKLDGYIDKKTLLFDLGNVGCTGGIKAINFVKNLNAEFKHILVLSVELPTTLLNLKSDKVDVWQGNCTFGDGASAIWISDKPGYSEQSFLIDKIHYVQQSLEGNDLIRWGYDNYYTFNIEDEFSFNKSVRQFVIEALKETESSWKDNPHWAIHPAGITILLRISRKLGIAKESMKPTTNHYEQFSNMSSSGILFIIKELQDNIDNDELINLITMGAGFNVIYGCLKKINA